MSQGNISTPTTINTNVPATQAGNSQVGVNLNRTDEEQSTQLGAQLGAQSAISEQEQKEKQKQWWKDWSRYSYRKDTPYNNAANRLLANGDINMTPNGDWTDFVASQRHMEDPNGRNERLLLSINKQVKSMYGRTKNYREQLNTITNINLLPGFNAIPSTEYGLLIQTPNGVPVTYDDYLAAIERVSNQMASQNA